MLRCDIEAIITLKGAPYFRQEFELSAPVKNGIKRQADDRIFFGGPG